MGSTDSALANAILESAGQIWLAGLGAFATAQTEGTKAFDAFVKEGERVQASARKVAGDRLGEVRDQVVETWDKLEDVFEGRVSRALRNLSVPHKRDVEALSKRVAELTAAVEELSVKMAGARAKLPVHATAAKHKTARARPAATHS